MRRRIALALLRCALAVMIAGAACAQNAFRPYTDLIPGNIAWFKSEADWIGRTGVGAPTDATKQPHYWRDNSLIWNWFWQPVAGDKEYTVIARNADGTVALTPIESGPAYGTYSLTVLNTYRENAFAFPAGIPYLKRIKIPAAEVRECNFAPGTPIDYPVEVGPDTLLVPQPSGVEAINYQKFLSLVRPPPMSDVERLELIKQILGLPATAAHKVLLVRKTVTDYYPKIGLN